MNPTLPKLDFTLRKFSKRFPAVLCATFVMHEPATNYSNGACCSSRGTAAAVILENGRFWIGVTLCGPKDQFMKKTGRNKATGRAVQAMFQGDRSDIIIYEKPDWPETMKRILREALAARKMVI